MKTMNQQDYEAFNSFVNMLPEIQSSYALENTIKAFRAGLAHARAIAPEEESNYHVLRGQVEWAINHHELVKTEGIFQHLRDTLTKIDTGFWPDEFSRLTKDQTEKDIDKIKE